MDLRALLDHVRKNHALEHATINLLSLRYPDAHIMGFSGRFGFVIYSTIAPEEVISSVREGLKQLRAGASQLAIHASCGTNLVVAASLTTLATLLGMGDLLMVGGDGDDRRSAQRWGWKLAERLPQAVLLNVIALFLAGPIGRWIQSHVTTNAELGELDVVSFVTDIRGGRRRVRVYTRLTTDA